MESATILKIFLASPSDVKAERELIFALKDDLDHLIGKPNKIRFEFVNWERSAYPGIGEDAQDVINQNIKDDYNIFIGIFWQRFGTPTSRAESGTKEEFDRAYQKYKKAPDSNHIMLYFKTAPPNNIYDLDYTQFEKVKNFKKEVPTLGVLYWEFEKAEELKNYLLIHLSSLIKDKYSILPKLLMSKTKESEPDELDKYELLASEIESNQQSDIEGILELNETATDSMNILPNISENIINAIKFIGHKFNDKTKEINAVNHIKDDRLRIKKATGIINKLAIDLDNYSIQINDLLPDFSETLNSAIESYTKLLLLASESSLFVNEVEKQLSTVFPELYDAMDDALIGIGDFLRILADLPSMTSKFGTSKRKAELATNDLMKEFIKSKKIMKQLITKEIKAIGNNEQNDHTA